MNPYKLYYPLWTGFFKTVGHSTPTLVFMGDQSGAGGLVLDEDIIVTSIVFTANVTAVATAADKEIRARVYHEDDGLILDAPISLGSGASTGWAKGTEAAETELLAGKYLYGNWEFEATSTPASVSDLGVMVWARRPYS